MNKIIVVALIGFLMAAGLVLIGCEGGGPNDVDGNNNGTTTREALSEDVWKDGNLTKDGQIKEYTISVTMDTMYFIWWNDSDNTNDRSKTCNVAVSARYSDGTPIFTKVNTGWSKPRFFTPTSSGTIIVSVQGYYSGNTGTYAVRYTTHSVRTVLSENVWKDDNLIADGQFNEYSFIVTNGITYFIWWNDSDNTNDRSKTCNVKVNARYSDGTPIFTNVNTGWSEPRFFTPTSSGTIIVSVQGYSSGNTGTYAVRYTTRQNMISLSANVWNHDSLITDNQVNEYSFTVQSDSSYYLWWNDSVQGDNSKTCNVKVSARYSNGVAIFTVVNSGWTTSQSFTPTSSGTIIVSVQGYSSGNTGTYAVAYTTTNSKP